MYRGGSLVDLVKQPTVGPPTRRLLHDVADAAADELTARARAHTPRRSGEVAASWRKLPVIEVANGYESGTTNPHYVARFLEYGVEPHTISPKTRKALGLPEGARAAAEHPGIRAHNMTAKAATEVEAQFPALAAPQRQDVG